VRRRFGYESVGFERNGENVAPATTADQDLAPTVTRPLDERHRGSFRGKYRGHNSGCAGTDYDGGGHDDVAESTTQRGMFWLRQCRAVILEPVSSP
jgi:hypothetical protein